MAKRIVLVTLMLLMCAIAVCSCKSEKTNEGGTESQGDALFSLTENGEPLYVILRGDECPKYEEDAAISLKNVLHSKFGVDFWVFSDYENIGLDISNRQEKEIIIGKCNGVDDIETELGENDYLIRTNGEKVIIYAKSSFGMNKAIEMLCSLIEKNVDGELIIKMKNEIIERNGDREYFDVENKTDLVGICYSMWFNPIVDGVNNPPNITKILNGEEDWGGLYAFHFWGEPALGYYRSDNKNVIRIHMTQLEDAGVDYIIVDNTNASLSWKDSGYWYSMIDEPFTALLDTIVEMRAEGLKTPYVVMWCSTANGWDVVDDVYEKFYTEEKYRNCFVYWSGKPFFLTTLDPSEKRENIVYRRQWGLLSKEETKHTWSFLNVSPDYVTYDSNGKPEQVCVNVAHQSTYMSLAETAVGRRGGLTFWECWQTAFKYHPKFITITWWNEWAAQRFEGNKFVDNYNTEYSRDIEPMKGGHGDKYYQWMKQYIAAYKSGEKCPKLVD